MIHPRYPDQLRLRTLDTIFVIQSYVKLEELHDRRRCCLDKHGSGEDGIIEAPSGLSTQDCVGLSKTQVFTQIYERIF